MAGFYDEVFSNLMFAIGTRDLAPRVGLSDSDGLTSDGEKRL